MATLIIRGKEVEIDNDCVSLIIYFNNNGLDTKYCCDGKNNNGTFYIMFEDYIEDSQMEEFLSKYRSKYDHSPFLGKFVKWCRVVNGKIKYNWMYLAMPEHAKYDYELLMEEVFNDK